MVVAVERFIIVVVHERVVVVVCEGSVGLGVGVARDREGIVV